MSDLEYEKNLKLLLTENKGILMAAKALDAGISKYHFYKYVKSEGLEKAAPGIYLSPDAWGDDLFILQARYSEVIFSHETALYLLDMADREPMQITVTAKGKYNAPKLTKQGIKIYRIKPELHTLGVCEMPSPGGHQLRVYNAERTICDIIRSRSNIEIQDYQTALKSYLRRKEKNIPLLMEYAEEFHVAAILRKYLEVIL